VTLAEATTRLNRVDLKKKKKKKKEKSRPGAGYLPQLDTGIFDPSNAYCLIVRGCPAIKND